MFLIKWRKKIECDKFRRIFPLVYGLTRYVTLEQAKTQVNIFRSHFPNNYYYIEKA